jgi:ADP-ribose pyrophosphatase
MLPKIVSVETRYKGRAFEVRVEEVEIRPGQIARLDVIQHAGAVTMLPLDGEGNVWFVRQYRHPAREYLLELPAGTLNASEDPALAANRELQEEIGMKADSLVEIATFFLAPGYSTELMHVYLATGLSASALAQDEDEVITLEKVLAGRAVEMARQGELRDAKSLVALLLGAHRLGW